MAENKTIILKAAGLVTSPNELERTDGALIEASNVIIRRDNIIEQRRGFDIYGNSLPDPSARVKQLTSYRNRILRHYENKLQFDSNGEGIFFDFSGNFLETEEGLRMKFIESNGNFYFTTSGGIKKISARNSSDFTTSDGYIRNAGAVKAVDLTGKILYRANSQSAWLPQDSAVAYRVLWAYKDLNTNLVRGTPSQRLVISNPMTDLLLQDYMRILSTLDNFTNTGLTSAMINDKNYVDTLGVNLTTSGNQLRSSSIALASKLDNDILFANQVSTAPLNMLLDSTKISNGICTITFDSGNPSDYFKPGSKIYLEGFNLTAQSEIQTISFSNLPTTGNWKIEYNGEETISLSHTISASTLENQLNNLTGLEDIQVTGSMAAGFTLMFHPSTASIAPLTITENTLEDAGADPTIITITTTQEGIPVPSGDINGIQEITNVDSNKLWFNTDAIGGVTLASATINSGTYRDIEEPSVMSLIPTNAELVSLQNYIVQIILDLSQEPDSVITPADKISVEELDITTTTTTELTITIPEGIDSDYFFQVYRSPVSQATGPATFDDVVPSDELQLVYEAYPTPDEIAEGFITFEDITPDTFRGENLYTNASTGEGILQANDIPPFAKDINRYRNCVFFANTRTRQRMDLNLLGVTRMIDNYDPNNVPQITISNGKTNMTYDFVLGSKLKWEITCEPNVADSLNGKYFLFDTLQNSYYVYFDSNSAIDPLISDRIGIRVPIDSDATAIDVSKALYSNLAIIISEISVNRFDEVIEVENFDNGFCDSPLDIDTGFDITIIQDGAGESVQSEMTKIVTIPGSDFVSTGPADYFTINNTFDSVRYLIIFNRGDVIHPVISGSFPIIIDITGNETADEVAQLIASELSNTGNFEGAILGNELYIATYLAGKTSPSTSQVTDINFQVDRIQEGRLNVLLSNLDSPARSVDETARSFVRVINKNRGDIIYAYYISSVFDVPGKINLEARYLTDEKFYILANSTEMGISFQPDIGPELEILQIDSGVNPTVTFNIPHNLITGDEIVLSGTKTTPTVNGLYSVEVTGINTVKLIGAYVNTPVIGGNAVAITAGNSVYSENEERGNRVYYSKFQQPEAVPIVNYFDVGAQDKDILRILPLRDSLFVFKEDGVYRISGESAPFQLELFDNSLILIAPDSASVCNNIIYCWTKQGIQSLSESGASIVSRSIDNVILKTQSSNYSHFSTATWGLGYESDNSYIMFTVSNMTDTVATIGYRYSTLTNSWTTFDMSKQAGIVNPFDDKMYLAPTDVSYIEQERKTFSRVDYTDRRLESLINPNALMDNRIILPLVDGFEEGDVVIQNQSITTTNFHMLLRKLDLDPAAESDYVELLTLSAGENPRSKLLNLAQKLDNDPGIGYSNFLSDIMDRDGTIDGLTEEENTIITSNNHGLMTGRVIEIINSNTNPSIDGKYEVNVIDQNRFSINVRVFTSIVGGIWQSVDSDFQDLKTCYNYIVARLNADALLTFSNYREIEDWTLMEAIITDINTITREITLNLNLDYLMGDIDIYKAFESKVTYSPITMGDPLMSKQIREATLMFETRTLTGGVLSFATDLLPEFQDIPFKLDGNGIFGHIDGFGDGFFGGYSNSAPFRTYIPRQCQRCRYMIVKFSHKTAREDYRLNGVTLTGRTQLSTRAYR